jgi:hypothetical protein
LFFSIAVTRLLLLPALPGSDPLPPENRRGCQRLNFMPAGDSRFADCGAAPACGLLARIRVIAPRW